MNQLQEGGAQQSGVGPEHIAAYRQQDTDRCQRWVESRGHDRRRGGAPHVRLGSDRCKEYWGSQPTAHDQNGHCVKEHPERPDRHQRRGLHDAAKLCVRADRGDQQIEKDRTDLAGTNPIQRKSTASSASPSFANSPASSRVEGRYSPVRQSVTSVTRPLVVTYGYGWDGIGRSCSGFRAHRANSLGAVSSAFSTISAGSFAIIAS